MKSEDMQKILDHVAKLEEETNKLKESKDNDEENYKRRIEEQEETIRILFQENEMNRIKARDYDVMNQLLLDTEIKNDNLAGQLMRKTNKKFRSQSTQTCCPEEIDLHIRASSEPLTKKLKLSSPSGVDSTTVQDPQCDLASLAFNVSNEFLNKAKHAMETALQEICDKQAKDDQHSMTSCSSNSLGSFGLNGISINSTTTDDQDTSMKDVVEADEKVDEANLSPAVDKNVEPKLGSSAEFIREKLKKLTSEFVAFFMNDTILSVRSGLLTVEAAILSFLECTLIEVVGEQLNDEYTEMVKSQLMVIAENILANPDLFA